MQFINRFFTWLYTARWLPWLVLAVSLATTYQLWRGARDAAEAASETDFYFQAHEAKDVLELHIRDCEQLLRGAAGLFVASQAVERDEFQKYVEMLDIAHNFPGIQALSFSLVVPEAQKDAHVLAMRKAGFANYTVQPTTSRNSYLPLIYVEPFVGLNKRALGMDYAADPVRRVAMEQARDLDSAVLSGRLAQQNWSDEQTDFMMFFPIYKNGLPHDTVEQRRANLYGYVSAALQMSEVMRHTLADTPDMLDIEIYDGAEMNGRTRVYDNDGIPRVGGATTARFQSIQRIEVAAHDWMVVTTSLPRFDSFIDQDKPRFVAIIGEVMSVLLTLFTWLLVRDRTRALRAEQIAQHELEERRHIEEQVRHLAYYDALTELPNRTLLMDRLQHAISRSARDKTPLAVMFIDLDDFKPVNDRYGHEAGDILLKQVAQRLQGCVRKSDTVARIGGDEFVVLLSSTEKEQDAQSVAEKILLAIKQPYLLSELGLKTTLSSVSVSISASIGVAIYPEHGMDEKILLIHADIAMYAAKQQGCNNVQTYREGMRLSR